MTTTQKAFEDWQRKLDRDPIFQKLQDELDKSWWQAQDESNTVPMSGQTGDHK